MTDIFIESMFINVAVETTPNTNTRKFSAQDHSILKNNEVLEFKSLEDCISSDLAMDIMNIQHVTSTLFTKDFISVTVSNDGIEKWTNIERLVCLAVTEALSSGAETINYDKINTSAQSFTLDMSDKIVQQINAIIDDQVKPAVARDGGDIDFVKFDGGVVYLKMKGACSGCPSSTHTLKNGIENMLKHYVPEVTSVQEWRE